MNILGIGPLELIFIFVLVLIVMGPNDMVKTGRTLGTFLGNLVRSDFWKAFQTASNEISSLPHKLAREAELDKLQNEIAPASAKLAKKTSDDLNTDGWVKAQKDTPPPAPEPKQDTQDVETEND